MEPPVRVALSPFGDEVALAAVDVLQPRFEAADSLFHRIKNISISSLLLPNTTRASGKKEAERTYLAEIIRLLLMVVVDPDIVESVRWPAEGSAMDFFVPSSFHAVADDGDC